MKRFVIVRKADRSVISIVERETTTEAVAECQKHIKAGHLAEWIKAEDIEDVAEKDPYVKIRVLLDQLKALHDAAPEEAEEITPAPKPAVKTWSNGKPKVTR